MEVHHQSNIHKNKWTHYLWEFIMLFLAVFCGFLAENMRENQVEKHRANELARSFYEELKGDSANVVVKINNRIRQEEALSYLMDYFKDSSLTHVSKDFAINFMYGILFRSPSMFEPRTVVLEQLKNSGSLRYFKNEELQKLVGELSVAIHNVIDRQSLESTVRVANLNPFIIDHYDYDFEKQLRKTYKADIFTDLKKYEISSDTIPFHFKGIDKFDKERSINIMGFYGMNGMESTRTIHLKKYTDINEALLKLLRSEYHLK